MVHEDMVIGIKEIESRITTMSIWPYLNYTEIKETLKWSIFSFFQLSLCELFPISISATFHF